MSVSDPQRYPHLLNVKNCFIRGSVVRYVHLAATDVAPALEIIIQQLRKIKTLK